MIMSECLLDKRRTLLFKRAIEQVVKVGDVVLELGTGSGILSLFAASAGARKVYAVEIAPDVANFASKNITSNNYSDKIEVVNSNALSLGISEKIDVVIMEMMDTGLVSEQQGPVLNQLKKKNIITKDTKIIPSRYRCAIDLVNYNFDFYGFKLPFIIQARNYSANRRVVDKLSKLTSYLDLSFNQDFELSVKERFAVIASKTGSVNSARLQSWISLAQGISTWGTSDMNMPVIIPLPKFDVVKGDKLEFDVSYQMGEGFKDFRLERH